MRYGFGKHTCATRNQCWLIAHDQCVTLCTMRFVLQQQHLIFFSNMSVCNETQLTIGISCVDVRTRLRSSQCLCGNVQCTHLRLTIFVRRLPLSFSSSSLCYCEPFLGPLLFWVIKACSSTWLQLSWSICDDLIIFALCMLSISLGGMIDIFSHFVDHFVNFSWYSRISDEWPHTKN